MAGPEVTDGSKNYRPKQLLTSQADARRVGKKLGEMRLGRVTSTSSPDLPQLVRFTWEDGARDPGAVVDEGRKLADEDHQGTPAASPNHLWSPDRDPESGDRMDPFVGQPVDMGGPAEPPGETKKTLRDRTAADKAGTGVTVGIIDTGILRFHPWMAGSYLATPEDFDPIDEDEDGELDFEAGHGTFVAGIVLQHAPGATVRVVRVLDRHGEAEVQSVANAMVRLANSGVDIINLSLGGYTRNNNEPGAFRTALTAIGNRVVVVAAAGNHKPRAKLAATTRKFWPAAFPEVVAVAALNPLSAAGVPKRATFSNFGEWVDVSAVGKGQVSTFATFKDKRGADFKGFATWNGTSFATPAVAGAIAARMTDIQGVRVRSAKEAQAKLLAEAEGKAITELTEGEAGGVGRFLRLPTGFAQ